MSKPIMTRAQMEQAIRSFEPVRVTITVDRFSLRAWLRSMFRAVWRRA